MRSLSFYVTAESDIIEEHLQMLVDRGIDTVGTDGINWMERDYPEKIIYQFRKLLDRYNMKVSSVHFAGPSFEVIGKSQNKVIDNLINAIEHFKSWQPSAMVVHWGWPWRERNDFPTVNDWIVEVLNQQIELDEEAVIQIHADNFKLLGKHAAQYGINIAVENLPPPWPVGEEPKKVIRTIEMADEPNVGMCLDSGHAHCSGINIAEIVRMIGPKLFETHFHDNKGPIESPTPRNTGDLHLPPGMGTIDWVEVIKALDETSFPGPVTFEGGGLGHGIEGIAKFIDITIHKWRTFERIAQNHDS